MTLCNSTDSSSTEYATGGKAVAGTIPGGFWAVRPPLAFWRFCDSGAWILLRLHAGHQEIVSKGWH